MKKRVLLFSVVLAVAIGLVVVSSTTAWAQAKVIKWRMQGVNDPGLMEYKMLPVAFADRVRELSNGRLDIKVFPPGGIVPSFEVFDAMRKGVLEISDHFLVYWSGKDPALKSPNEFAYLRDAVQGCTWYYQFGGAELYRKVLAKHGLYHLGVSALEGEQFWSRKPLKGVADLKGLKMRAAGLAADMAAILGASVVVVPGGEVYSALERGVIDACEFTTPTVNYGLGLQEVTKYIIFPTYSGGGYEDWFVNMKAWQALPDDLKRIVDVALKETAWMYYLKVRLETQIVFEKLQKRGMTFITWSKEDMDKLEAARIAVLEKYGTASPEFKEINDSRAKLLKILSERSHERVH
jgi:TRAP-type mannitol/chloroaromatic compound transport system substrate-binding protein